jgi:hypothetical protein
VRAFFFKSLGRLGESSSEIGYKLRELLHRKKYEATPLLNPERQIFTGKRVGKRVIERI